MTEMENVLRRNLNDAITDRDFELGSKGMLGSVYSKELEIKEENVKICQVILDEYLSSIKTKTIDLVKFSVFAQKMHNKTNCSYDGKDYYTHVKMVEDGIDIYRDVFKLEIDYIHSRAGGSGHDLIEDCRLNFNNIVKEANEEVGNIILAVTDAPAENRLMRHLLTMPKTVKDYRAIIVKMADLRANASYSKMTNSSMYPKYCSEYLYRRPIFKAALLWYRDYLNMERVEEFWAELDEIHCYSK